MFEFKKTQYENIYEWAEKSTGNCFYCNNSVERLALQLLGEKGICPSCLEAFEIGHLGVDRHVVHQITPAFKTEQEAYEWFAARGQVVRIGAGRYHFVNDHETYEEYRAKAEAGGIMLNPMRYMQSYNDLEIDRDGSYHIVY